MTLGSTHTHTRVASQRDPCLRFRLEVTSAVPGDVAFVYAWSMVDDGNGTDVTQLLPQRNASVLEVLPGAFPVGRSGERRGKSADGSSQEFELD